MAEMDESNTGEVDGNTPAIERLERDLAREHDRYLRALADFDNYRRRVERDRASAAQSGKREIILPLLDVLDGFDRALQQIIGAPPAVIEGFEALRRKLLGLLAQHGVTPFSAVGESFDPELHEAIGTVRSDELAANTVAEELQRGYRWGDEVIRPARVRVVV